MTIHYQDDTITLHHGDSLDVLRTLDAGSVNCCVTSPPYFGLRDYGMPGQIGAEKSPAEYVERLRVLFAEVRRVLSDDGTLWLNLGDSYSSGGRKTSHADSATMQTRAKGHAFARPVSDRTDKNLLGIPWRVAFALQDDGWILRNAIVWSKPNAMPESVTDRLSTRYEMVFMFSKARRYWFDLDPIREAASSFDHHARYAHREYKQRTAEQGTGVPGADNSAGIGGPGRIGTGAKNPGDVWEIATTPFPGAHFATMPPEPARRCIVAGCPPRVCNTCGKATVRVQGEKTLDESRPQARRALQLAEQHGLTPEHIAAIRSAGVTDAGKAAITQSGTGKNTDEVTRLAAEAKAALGGYYREFLLGRSTGIGWSDCGHDNWRAGVVLDPFHGSGTTGMVAERNGRKYVGIELNREYLDLSLRTRLADGVLDFDGGAA